MLSTSKKGMAQRVTRLGRWCLPSSPVYASACKQDVKAMQADSDNSVWTLPPLKHDDHPSAKTKAPTRDPISALANAFHVW